MMQDRNDHTKQIVQK